MHNVVRLAERFSRCKIRTRLILCQTGIMLAAVATIYLVCAPRIEAAVVDSVRREIRYSTVQIASNITDLVASYEKEAEFILYNKQFLADITSPRTASRLVKYEQTKEAKSIMGLIQTVDPTIQSVSAYLLHDALLLDGKTLADIGKNAVALDDMEANYGALWVGRHKNALNQDIVTLYRSIYDFPATLDCIGVLALEIKESQFRSYIENEAQDKSILIINDLGQVVTAAGALQPTDGDLGAIREVTKHSAEPFAFDIGGSDCVVFSAPAADGWTVLSYLPQKRLRTAAASLQGFVTMAAAIACLVMIVITCLSVTLLTRRLSAFAKAMRQVERERYDFRLDIRGGDEVGELAHAFNRMAQKLSSLFNETYRSKLQAQEAELRMLQAQMNPHFLYNALSSIGYVALRRNAPDVRKTLVDLSKFYRFSLSKGCPIVTLEAELEHVATYMAIQRLRFGDLVELASSIPESLRDNAMLRLTIQPLVENCINHARANSQDILHISVCAYEKDNAVHLEVEDDGAGMPEGLATRLLSGENASEKFGLANVDAMVRLYFGPGYGLRVFSAGAGQGFKATVIVPRVCAAECQNMFQPIPDASPVIP